MYKYVKSDYDATIPDDLLYAPDGDENTLRNLFRSRAEADKIAKQEAEKAAADKEKAAADKEKIEQLQKKYTKDAIEQAEESDDRIEALFELAVPSYGKCDSVAGEIVRAMMKILYRDYNDGDVFYEGYGKETCLPAVSYLCTKFPELLEEFEEIAEDELKDAAYTSALNRISAIVCENLFRDDIELFWTPNTEDYLKSDPNKYEFYEPTYMYEGDWTEAMIEALFDDKISEHDAQLALENALSWERIEYEYLTVGEYGWSIEGLNYDDLEKLQEFGYSISESVADDLEIDSIENDEEEEDW